MQDLQPTYLLLHGAWHGKWCWEKVIPLLQKENVQVIAPNLPGHEEEKRTFVGITLRTYVDFVKELIHSLPGPVYLVGHSLAGVIISQVAEEIPEKIKKLIYVASLLPSHGSSCVMEASMQEINNVGSLLSQSEQTNEMLFDLSDPIKVKNAFYHCCTEEDFQAALKRLQPEPLLPMVETVTLSAERFGKVKKVFIECMQDRGVDIHNQRRMINNAKIKEVISLECDHSPFLSMPGPLAKALLNHAS